MLRRTTFILLATLACSSVFAAESDTVSRISTDKGVSGQITSVSRLEVVVHQPIGNRDDRIPASDIADVEWRHEPAPLGLARGYEKTGNLVQSLASYQEGLAAIPASSRDMRADVEFRIARIIFRQAQNDPAKLQPAVERLKSWTDANREHFRYFAAQRLLGDAAIQQNDHLLADSAFDRLQQSPWPELQQAGKLGLARSALAQGRIPIAKGLFDELAGLPADAPGSKSARWEAMLGQADCLRRMEQPAQAAEKLQLVIDQTGAGDDRLLAQAYLQLGACRALDNSRLKDAVLAYLHVDVVPTLAAHQDLHAEALYHLARLWGAIGQPARGVEAAEKLKQQYPESPWTKKL